MRLTRPWNGQNEAEEHRYPKYGVLLEPQEVRLLVEKAILQGTLCCILRHKKTVSLTTHKFVFLGIVLKSEQ